MDDKIPAMTETAALESHINLLEELLASKDRELAAREETLVLLREKVSRLEKTATRSSFQASPDPRDGFHFVAGLEDPWAGSGGRAVRTTRKPPNQEASPKGMWARFYHWFREA